MPQSRRGRRPRLAGSRVTDSSLPRAPAQPPRQAVRGARPSSHAQHLTRRRHSSEQVPEGPEPQADFRSGKWLQERAGGDAGDSRLAPRAEMGSRDRSVPAVPLGRATPCTAAGIPVLARKGPRCAHAEARFPRRPGRLGTGRPATVLFRALPRRYWTRLQGGPETGPPLIGRSPVTESSLQPAQF